MLMKFTKRRLKNRKNYKKTKIKQLMENKTKKMELVSWCQMLNIMEIIITILI